MADPLWIRDDGGDVVSIAGLHGRGRQSRIGGSSWTTGATGLLVPANPRRISLFIQFQDNTFASQAVLVVGFDPAFTSYGFNLSSNGSVLIDRYAFPWAGEVYAAYFNSYGADTMNLIWVEVEVSP